jgi:hypothetical protein
MYAYNDTIYNVICIILIDSLFNYQLKTSSFITGIGEWVTLDAEGSSA